MNQFTRLVDKCIDCPLFHFQKPAPFSVVDEKTLWLNGNYRTVTARKLKAVGFLKGLNVAVFSAAA